MFHVFVFLSVFGCTTMCVYVCSCVYVNVLAMAMYTGIFVRESVRVCVFVRACGSVFVKLSVGANVCAVCVGVSV